MSKKVRIISACAAVFFLTVAVSLPVVSAGFRFSDPQIPDNETIRYLCTSDNRTFEIRESITTVRRENKLFYSIASLSPPLDTFITIDRSDMRAIKVRTVQKYDTATLETTLQVIDEVPSTMADAVNVPHFAALTHLLRGFSFKRGSRVRILYYGGTERKKFNLRVKYKRKETLRIQNRDIACYKLEFGLEGLWGAFLPELELWYAAAPPHYLVRYKGPEGPPGTPDRFIELIEYRAPEE